MTLLVCHYHEDFTRKVTEGENSHKEYERIFRVVYDRNTDDKSGTDVLVDCRAATPGANFVLPAKIGDPYTFGAFTDEGSRAKEIVCELEDPNVPHVFKIVETYRAPDAGGKLNFLGPSPPGHPLQWPSKYWLDVTEEQGVVEKAVCFSNLTSIMRDITSPKGPIVNSAGQQTIDPLVTMDYRIILNALVYYPSGLYAMALNNQFGRTCHYHDDYATDPSGDESDFPLLMGCPYYTWKFLSATTNKGDWRQVTEEDQEEVTGDDIVASAGSILYFPTTIRFEFRLGDLIDETDLGWEGTTFLFNHGWIRKVLNNGQVCFRKFMDDYLPQERFWEDPRFGDNRKMQLPTTALQLKDTFDGKYNDTRSSPSTPRTQPGLDDFEERETAEPINLELDGTQISDPEADTRYVYYLDLKQANYYDITDYFGNSVLPEEVTLPTFPLTPGP
jgi:hypothetical protein